MWHACAALATSRGGIGAWRWVGLRRAVGGIEGSRGIEAVAGLLVPDQNRFESTTPVLPLPSGAIPTWIVVGGGWLRQWRLASETDSIQVP